MTTPTGDRPTLDQLPPKAIGIIASAIAIAVGLAGLVLFATDTIDLGGGTTTSATTTTEPPSTETVPTVTTEPPSTGTTPSTAPPPMTRPPSAARLTHLDNPSGMVLVGADLTADEAEALAFTSADPFTWPANPRDNGPSPQGQFRLLCTVSHFATEDPVVHPGEPGAGHLHMFFGNIEADADSTGESLLSSGASTCQGGALNRSAYWLPAMVDGDRVVMPEAITLYYKSHRPESVSGIFPVGLQLLAGLEPGGVINREFRKGERLHWGCYNGSSAIDLRDTIPGTNGTRPCPAGWPIQATLQFPQCIAAGEVNSPDHVSHTEMLFNEGGNYGEQNRDCPASHPYRVPQISYLVRFATQLPDGTPVDVSGWRLSCDEPDDEGVIVPGGCLHADLISAWAETANQTWIDGCYQPSSRNCSLGQTGTARAFRTIVGPTLSGMVYRGPQLLPIEP